VVLAATTALLDEADVPCLCLIFLARHQLMMFALCRYDRGGGKSRALIAQGWYLVNTLSNQVPMISCKRPNIAIEPKA